MINRIPNTKCSICGKPVYRRPLEMERGPVFCSVICSNRRNALTRQCSVCAKQLETHQMYTCSRTCSNKSRTGSKYGNDTGKDKAVVAQRLKQDLVLARGGKCNRCDFTRVEILHVHHIVERCNGGTDEHSNLELLCPNCHTMHHYLLKLEARRRKNRRTCHE